ncbi:MAG: penicillin-binding transpeptidase domain-containing protein [Bacillota bacterium]
MYSTSGDLPLFNRALQGAYPPGSIFKLLTYAAAVETDPAIIDRRFLCPGSLEIEGRRLNCIATHGEISLKEALARSCNVVFAQVAMELGETRLRDQAETMGINKRIPADFPVKVSSFGPAGEMSANALVETGIGQGELAITPLQAALLVAAVANDGILMKPYLLKAKALPGKEFTDLSQPQAWRRVMGSRTAHYLKEAMVEAVQSGTARRSRIAGIEVAGKTGSAENPQGGPMPGLLVLRRARHPRVAVAVILENAGSGGTYAAPVAREMIQLTLSLVGEEK